MIDNNSNDATDLPDENVNDGHTDEDEISKSQRKRDADSVRDLGKRLTELSSSELATIPVSDDVLAAIREFSRIKAHGARKRQLGFLAKRLRNVDVTAIDEALEQIRQTARANTLNLHLVENWRDRLLGDIEGETAKQALTAFLDQYKQADRQKFRHLQAQALKERQLNKPPASARSLFKSVRDVVAGDSSDSY